MQDLFCLTAKSIAFRIKLRMKKSLFLPLIVILLAISTGCGNHRGYKINELLDTSKPVRLNFVGTTPSFMAMEKTISSFCALYPNVTIEYEYLQNYKKSLLTRLSQNDDIDLFITSNIQLSSPIRQYAMELKQQSSRLNLSETYDGLIRNFTITSDGKNELYAIPLGGELRGMYVNKTLLSSLHLSVPHTYEELLHCCDVLKKAGYTPLQGNPSYFGQLLMYPYVCNLIANSSDYKKVYSKINSCAPGVSLLFTEPMKRLYEITSSGYYDYKSVEIKNFTFLDSTEESMAKSFLNLEDTVHGIKKIDDVGKVAFMPGTMSLKPLLNKDKIDYYSKIDYEFILSPVSDDGGFAYLSPSAGIAINKNGGATDWALEFLNYLFTDKISRSFANNSGIIPNTKDAYTSISHTFKIDSNHICQLGQVSFDYVFYDIIHHSLVAISKCNNPKYFSPENKMYDFDHYMEELENDFAKQRTGDGQ